MILMKYILTILLSVLWVSALAQTGRVLGTDGPLAGATVRLMGASLVTRTET